MNTINKIVIYAILLLPIFANAQIRSFDDCSNVGNPENFAFQNGESLTLVANYKWGLVNTSIGEATMRLQQENYNNEIHYVVLASAKTYGFFDGFFKVRDNFTSKFNAFNMRPSYFAQDVHEGKYTKKSTMYFDWNAKKITGKKKRKEAPEKDYTANLYDCQFDLMTFVYYLRNIDFNSLPENSKLTVKFAFDDKANDLFVTYIGKSRVKTKCGHFNCVKVSIQTLESETFSDEDQMYFFISDDENHIPLYMEMPLKIGHVRISLSSYSNLKYPLTSKYK